MLIYYCGIRRKECLALKISDVYFHKNLIIIKPNIEEENSKTKSIRMVPLNPFIKEMLKVHTENYDSSLYLFGSPNARVGQRGKNKGNISGSVHNQLTRIKRS